MADQIELRAAAARLMYSDNSDIRDYNMLIEFIDSIFKEKEEEENPKPLTIDELRQMHGEPVFVTVPGKPHRSRWCIVDLVSPCPGLLGMNYFCDMLVAATPAVRVYRHKPKEE